MITRNLFIIFNCLLGCMELIEGGRIRRFNYDARLYEHFQFDSRYIQYSRTEPEEWMDIPTMMKNKNFTFNSMICTTGPGAWIFYPDPNYEMGNSQLYYLVVGEHCVRSDDIDSIQPLGKMDEIMEQGVILFTKPDFGSTPTLVLEGEGSGEATSLIFTGATPFAVSGGTKKVCLRPVSTVFEYAYCLLPDIKSQLGMEGSVTAKEGCSEEEESDEINLFVENCYPDGVYELYTDQDLTIDKINEVCSGGGDDFAKTKFTVVMDMWNKRMGNSIQETPGDYFDQVKVDMVWKVLAIFTQSCLVVDPLYTYLIGHFYLKHAREMWNKEREEAGTQNQPPKNDTEIWWFTQKFFGFCTEHNQQLPTLDTTCRTDDEYNRVVTSGVDPEASWFEIANGQIFDTVIEQMWLIMNTVIPSCNRVAGYITNDWSELVYIFHKNFLDPLQEQWADPGDWSKIYQAVLHGYDVRQQHRHIVMCLETALRNTPDYDPIGRPKSFNDYLLYKYNIPKNGEVPNNRKRSVSPTAS